MHVALATENNAVDGAILMELLALLGVQATVWATAEVPMRGWQGVHRNLARFLDVAWADGVSHALVSIDNDGRPTNRPPHDSSHVVAEQMQDRKNGCRTCRLLEVTPPAWLAPPRRLAIVVPVQVIETWLLALDGYSFAHPTPERNHDRDALKRAFWREYRSGTPDNVKVELARARIHQPGALDLLLQRPSFQDFRNAVAAW